MELKINIPDGYEIDQEKSTFERIVFKESEKPSTYNNIAVKLFTGINCFYLGKSGEIIAVNDIDVDYMHEPHLSVTKEQLESFLASNKLANVAKYLNGGWLPDWEDSIQFKYHHYIHNNRVLKISFSNLSKDGNVFFKTRELAEQAIEILTEPVIRQALTLNH